MIRTISLTLALAGCATLKFESAGPPATAPVTHAYVTSHFFWGALRNDSAPVPACPAGAFRSATLEQSTADVLLTGITLGIYVPHRAIVSCAK